MHHAKWRGRSGNETELAEVCFSGCGQGHFNGAGTVGAFDDILFEDGGGGAYHDDKQGKQGEEDGGNHDSNLGSLGHAFGHRVWGMLTPSGAQVKGACM